MCRRHSSTRAPRRAAADARRARRDARMPSRASTIVRVGRARAPVRKTVVVDGDDDADALALGCTVHGARDARAARDAKS